MREKTELKVGDWVWIQYGPTCRHIRLGQIESLSWMKVVVKFLDGDRMEVPERILVKASDLEVLSEWGKK